MEELAYEVAALRAQVEELTQLLKALVPFTQEVAEFIESQATTKEGG